MPSPTRIALQAIWRDRIHVQPGLLEALPRPIADLYMDVWAPARQLLQSLELLPVGLLERWACSDHGHILLTPRDVGYLPGPQPIPAAMRSRLLQEGQWQGLCQVAVLELASGAHSALDPVAHWLDHLLGSAGQAEGAWFADGAGATPTVAEWAARFQRIAARGYGCEVLGARTERDYFARTLWLYARASQELNVLDPPLYRLYRDMFQHARLGAESQSTRGG